MIALKEYAHVMTFHVEGEQNVFMTLSRDAFKTTLSGVISQIGYEPFLFTYGGRINIPVLVEVIKGYQ